MPAGTSGSESQEFRSENSSRNFAFALNVRDKKIPKTRLHFLRHYHATWLYENDVQDQSKNHRAPTRRK
ncbi:hypothetical protein E4K67_13260 [Desulfosporosinus fructosivorans]|uniref:Uncharacterized protein n=1 Tax=Desulfosporosinus fructosivorans TaxID=2018669 RepID=A0A4Z0R6U0_9FIRM|nr:hypothetical protein E4K67_13260 [Desulfosporosinus fructosivorans]